MLQRLNTKCWSFIGMRLPLSPVFRDSLQDIWWKCETSVKKGHYHIFVSCLFRNSQMSCWRVSRGTSDTWERLLGIYVWLLIWSEELTGTQWTPPRYDRTLPPPPVGRKTCKQYKTMFLFFCLRGFLYSFSYFPGCGSWWLVTERQRTQPSTYVVREKVSKWLPCLSWAKWYNNVAVAGHNCDPRPDPGHQDRHALLSFSSLCNQNLQTTLPNLSTLGLMGLTI